MKLRTSLTEIIDELIMADIKDMTTQISQEYAVERYIKPIEHIKSK
jgi:hypothetical protein